MGRFINADKFAATGQGILGANMFAYCLNNPVNRVDSTGNDAIWIQEGGSAEGAGHSGLMVQDDGGNWWYFYWGPKDERFRFELFTGVENGSYFVKIQVSDNSDLEDTEIVRQVLADSGTKASERAQKITSTRYFHGDYYATYVAAKELIESGEKYFLASLNCVECTMHAFLASDSRFSLVCYNDYRDALPNSVYNNVALLPGEKRKFPWVSFFLRLLEEINGCCE